MMAKKWSGVVAFCFLSREGACSLSPVLSTTTNNNYNGQVRNNANANAKVNPNPALCSTAHDLLFEEVRNEHEQEIQRGFETFGQSDQQQQQHQAGAGAGAGAGAVEVEAFTDDDFDVLAVGTGNAGPLEFTLQRGSDIFRTQSPILTPEECQELIGEAQQVIAKDLASEREATDKNNNNNSNSDNNNVESRKISNAQLNEAKLSDLPQGNKKVQTLLQNKLFPMLAERFGVDASGLTLNDALIIGYIGPSRSQPIHRDASLLSLQIALSPTSNYRGGGTYFEALQKVPPSPVMMEQGHVLCHSSGSMHAGRGVEAGERWILVLFVLSKNEAQLAKRCHAKGVTAMDENYLEQAEQWFLAGLSAASSNNSKDHLLHMSLANCYSRQGNDSLARRHLLLSADAYKSCPKACMVHANILLAKNRPRAALRRLELALEGMGDKDVQMQQPEDTWVPLKATGWEIRIQAGRAACMCAEKELERVEDGADRTFTLQHLPMAIDRFEVALQSAPNHPPLLAMMGRGKELLMNALN